VPESHRLYTLEIQVLADYTASGEINPVLKFFNRIILLRNGHVKKKVREYSADS